MRCHPLGLFETPAVEQINRDASGPEGVAADRGLDAGLFRRKGEYEMDLWVVKYIFASPCQSLVPSYRYRSYYMLSVKFDFLAYLGQCIK
jgi:hypothetical protein